MSTHNFLKSPLTAGIVGCPFSGGQPKEGVDTGPRQLIEAGLLDDIKTLGYHVEFEGADSLATSLTSDQPDPDIGILKKPRLVSKVGVETPAVKCDHCQINSSMMSLYFQVTQELADRVFAHASKGHLTVTLGGDHSLVGLYARLSSLNKISSLILELLQAMGTVSGTFRAYPEAALIWIDAHADINTPLTTPSGNLHGCPVSFLMGLPGTSPQEIPEFGWCKPVLKPSRIVYIGLRDIDSGERKILKENNIKCFSMFHVDKYGIGKVVDMALEHVGRDRPLHLSFDVDAMDPEVAPSTGTAVRGGLTFREGHYICEALAETGNLVSLDLMEVNPSLGDDLSVEQTISVGRSLVRCALGETLL
ncbi:BZ3500_MvSof-1268-A1-R1_Chr2-3g05291 [Microbotryum saponariae]|uniref:Arginase n=1 Tax=Microbotryum saponariae TaxID=289078 RepID=A0A2X0L7Z2_9BASI|nr:BZ3500_MvSof-1268-A1-R1_Chr2-3g05291 [Microbotryum saponariae]SDA01130.1 BZ3501_MvSof-1269-A2-R1_Chr2-2g04964 [Microbotryum saponariae]